MFRKQGSPVCCYWRDSFVLHFNCGGKFQNNALFRETCCHFHERLDTLLFVNQLYELQNTSTTICVLLYNTIKHINNTPCFTVKISITPYFTIKHIDCFLRFIRVFYGRKIDCFSLFLFVLSNYASPTSGEAYRDRRLTTNFELWVEIFCVPTCFHVGIPKPCLSVCLSVRLSICPYPEKRNHHSFVNISPTLVIDTSMERSSRVLRHGNPKIWFFFSKKFEIRILTFDEELKSP